MGTPPNWPTTSSFSPLPAKEAGPQQADPPAGNSGRASRARAACPLTAMTSDALIAAIRFTVATKIHNDPRCDANSLSRSKIGFGWLPAGLRASDGVPVFVDQAVEDRFEADPLCVDVGHGGAGSVTVAVGDVLCDAWCGLAVL